MVTNDDYYYHGPAAAFISDTGSVNTLFDHLKSTSRIRIYGSCPICAHLLFFAAGTTLFSHLLSYSALQLAWKHVLHSNLSPPISPPSH